MPSSFKEYCSICLPACGKYFLASDEDNKIEKVIVLVVAIAISVIYTKKLAKELPIMKA